MDIIFLTKIALSLTAILFVLIYFLFIKPSAEEKKKKEKKKKKVSKPKKKIDTDLKHLISIVKDKTITSKTLKETLELIIKYHGTIPNKIGSNNHPNFVMYEDVIFAICRHPNTNSTIITQFISSLEKKNENYKPQINDALTRGLNSRGF